MRSFIPPFIDIEVVSPGTPEYDALPNNFVMFEVGENLLANMTTFTAMQLNSRLLQVTDQMPSLPDAATTNGSGQTAKLGIPLLKRGIASIVTALEPKEVEGATKVYIVHSPALKDDLHRHLADLPVPAYYDSMEERLISVTVDGKTLSFTVTPYMMGPLCQADADERWLLINLYNPHMPSMAIAVAEEGFMALKEPTPLLGDTEAVETWAMEKLTERWTRSGIHVQNVGKEPNGPKTFPDYTVSLNQKRWTCEITRVLGTIPTTRRVLDQPRDRIRNMERAVQSPPLLPSDIEAAVGKAITDKTAIRRKQSSTNRVCLVLVNVLDRELDKQSTVWQQQDLAAFDAVVLISGFSEPRVEWIKALRP